MIIVVEGPNNVGKTTFIDAFLKKHKDFSVRHITDKDDNTIEFYESLLSTSENMIYDRCHPGEMVYPVIYGRESNVNIVNFPELCEKHRNVVYIFIDATDEFKIRGFNNKHEDYDMQMIIKEQDLFNSVMRITKLYSKTYYIMNDINTVDINTKYLLEELNKLIEQENCLTKGYAEDAGTDVHLIKDVTLKANSITVIDLGISVPPAEGTMSFLVARTSAAIKGIHVESCPIDANYNGTINAIVYNMSDNDITYLKGEAFCQLVTVPIVKPNYRYKILKEGKSTDGKFGSTNRSK